MNDDGFDAWVQQLDPTIVVFDRFMTEEQFGWRVREQCPNALLVLDTEDLHFLRKARESATKAGSLDALELNSEVAYREIASIFRCDLSLIISTVELKLLQSQFSIPSSLLHYLPIVVEQVKSSAELPSFEQRAGFCSIGNFKHPPNRDAVQVLVRSVWPLIRTANPNAELFIYGAYPGAADKQLHQPTMGIYFEGAVPDAHAAMARHRVLISPLRFGAGIKGKFLEAAQAGTPNVTTPIGAEGLLSNDNWPGFVGENYSELADAALALSTDSDAWYLAQQKGFKGLKDQFHRAAFERPWLERMTATLERLESHRSSNFMGAMLNHHQHNSTKYMSKWITEKQRNLNQK